MSGAEVVAIADVDATVIRKEDLQRVWNVRIAILQSVPDLEDLLPYLRQKTKTELYNKVSKSVLILLHFN
jgi:hypothetical protein